LVTNRLNVILKSLELRGVMNCGPSRSMQATRINDACPSYNRP
jgi:hypothetical protein